MILQAARVRFSRTEYIACPGCGRTLYDLEGTLARIKERTGHLKNLRIGVMGCIVNGPGEAREADLGVASGNGKGQIFIKGKVIQTVPEDQIVETLLVKAQEIAAQMEADGQVSVNATGPVVVPVAQGNC